jgi:NAD-dependent deacetylase
VTELDEWAKGIEGAVELLLGAKYVVGLTGAGMSVESNIPPFRGPGGLWTRYGEPPMDGYQKFLADPRGDWERRIKKEGYTRELYEALERASPNPGHYAFAELEEMGILKCLITQNVDNLHRVAGGKNLAEIHGNRTLIRCLRCNSRFPEEEVSLEVLPPPCPHCGGIMKTDIVIFGELIPPDVLQKCQVESQKCDCMLVAGTSATVYPAAGFPGEVRRKGGSLIEVNPYETELTPLCRVSLRGNSGEILPKLVEGIKNKKGS